MNQSTLSIASNFKCQYHRNGDEFNNITAFCLKQDCQKNSLMCIECIDYHEKCQVFSFREIDNLFQTHQQNYESRRVLFTKLKQDIIAKLEEDEKLLFQCFEKFYKIDKIKSLVQQYEQYKSSLKQADLESFLNNARENIKQDGSSLQFIPLQTNIIKLFHQQIELMKTRIEKICFLLKDSRIEHQEIQVMKNMNTDSFFNPPINPKELVKDSQIYFKFESINYKPFTLVGIKSNRIISNLKSYTIKFQLKQLDDNLDATILNEQLLPRFNTDLDAFFVIELNNVIYPQKKYYITLQNTSDAVLQLSFFHETQENGFIKVIENNAGQFPVFLIDILNMK